MKVLVIGANGNTGQRLLRRLAAGPHDPVAMIRDAGQRGLFDDMGVPTVLGDVEYPIDHAVRGCDAVIFAAGSGSKTGKDKTVLVDHIGAIRSMVAAQESGAQRYIMLSSINADINSTSTIAHYHKAKAHADYHLRQTDLDYTIVCPGGLTDEPDPGTADLSARLTGRGMTSRETLAEVMARCLDADNTIRKAFSVLDGDVPLAEALAGL
ncbi:MAG: NAD-dependent dehydratase [Gammaproteobacteria bacterium]|nr:NAD-dependent dehydratase [Gammaproteobacteria bacterium]